MASAPAGSSRLRTAVGGVRSGLPTRRRPLGLTTGQRLLGPTHPGPAPGLASAFARPSETGVSRRRRACASPPAPSPTVRKVGGITGGITGLATLAIAGLWLAYLVPHRLRFRHQMVESRHEDRFSESLRVITVAQQGARHRGGAEHCTADITRRPALVPVPQGGQLMDRPQITRDRIRAEAARRAAAERAAHAALLSRRAAAARRRAAIAATLAVATVGGWIAVATGVVLLVAAVPTVLLAAVLVMGRRAVIAGNEADRQWARRNAELSTGEAADRVTGRAVHPSSMLTEAIPVAAPAEQVVEQQAPAAAATDWMPIPVPAPTYTFKAEAPRREQAALAPMEASTVLRPDATAPEVPSLERAEADDEAAASTTATATAVGSSVVAPSGSIDIDAVLARRRASGE